MDKGNSAQSTTNNRQKTPPECLVRLGGLSQRWLCQELKSSLCTPFFVMSVSGLNIWGVSRSTTQTWKRGNTILQDSRSEWPLSIHKRTAHSLSKQSPNEIFKLNFAHQTPDHAHSHGKIWLLASSCLKTLHQDKSGTARPMGLIGFCPESVLPSLAVWYRLTLPTA